MVFCPITFNIQFDMLMEKLEPNMVETDSAHSLQEPVNGGVQKSRGRWGESEVVWVRGCVGGDRV